MSHATHPIGSVRYHAEKSLEHASPAIELAARIGYAAKGVVYIVVGGLAVLAAFGKSGGQTTGSHGAIHTLLDKPAGVVLVSMLAAGLACYAMWCLIQAIFDPEHHGKNGPKRIGLRAFRFFKGIVHGMLVVAAIGMVTGRNTNPDGTSGDSNIEEWTAKLMSLPLGLWLVGIAGASVIGYGAYQLYRAWTADLDKHLSLGQLDAKARRPAIYTSRFGIGARGVVFGVIGVGLILAALHANPNEARGFGGALSTLARQPYGPWLLATTAVGLMAYGLYELLRARYRIIHPSKNG